MPPILGFTAYTFSTTDKDYCDAKRKPNIILIMADDLGWNDVGWHNSDVITPNLDRLASNGVILENSYVQPTCTPSRAAILTGKYPHRLGLQWLVIKPSQAHWLPRNETLLPETLKGHGYTTHLVGNLKRKTKSSTEDIDHVQYKDLFTKRSVEIIKNSTKSSAPFFLDLSHTAPHFPLQIPKHFTNLYPDVEDLNRRKYLGMVSSLDDSVGRIVKALEENKVMDNTIIIFLSDNGGDIDHGASNLPLRGMKGNLYEGGVKSASFVYSPSYLPKSCVHHGMIHAADWFSTIQGMAGIEDDHPDKISELSFVDSVNQWPSIQKCRQSARNEMVLSIDDDVSNTAAIRVGDYKLITGDPRVIDGVVPDVVPANPRSTAITLYNLKDDPYETTNIDTQFPQVVREMMKKMDEYRKFSVPAQNDDLTPFNITQPNGIVTTGWC